MTVLVVEDDEIISEGLAISLEQEGYQVLKANTQAKALELLESDAEIDISLLDINLPDGDGYTVCRQIRKKSRMPIIFLTACDDEIHTVLALEQGADDYISKPFRIRELLARMKAILRRSGAYTDTQEKDKSIISVGDAKVNIHTAKVYREDEEIVLTAMEYKLLLIFIQHRGENISRQQILSQIWDDAGDFVNDKHLKCVHKKTQEKTGGFGRQSADTDGTRNRISDGIVSPGRRG